MSGPTKGPVVADPYFAEKRGGRKYIPVIKTGDAVPIAVVHLSVDGYGHEEGLANAGLITEAFNVLTETGLTPRQLAEQRERLREALDSIARFGSVNLASEWGSGLRGIIRSMTDRARAALAKATGEPQP